MRAPYFQDETLTLLVGNAADVLGEMPSDWVDCVVTSPPYFGLRDYLGHPDQIGTERAPVEYVARLTAMFRKLARVLVADGTVWLNLGDSYSDGRYPALTTAGSVRPGRPPAKNLMGIPWRVAFALQREGWTVRNAIVWHKPNAMPESVTDRLSARYELVFLLTKSRRYAFDLDPIRECYDGDRAPSRRAHRTANKPHTARGEWTAGERGRNPGDLWSIPTTPLPDAHFAAFPVELPRRCILAGSPPGGMVLDPFSGAGTTALAAQQLGRRAVGIDINPEYHDIALRRVANAPLPFGEVKA